MEIKNVFNEGDVLTPEQLAQVTGGTQLCSSNLNEYEKCSCYQEGDNVNRAKGCYCGPLKTNSNCSGFEPQPGPGHGSFDEDVH